MFSEEIFPPRHDLHEINMQVTKTQSGNLNEYAEMNKLRAICKQPDGKLTGWKEYRNKWASRWRDWQIRHGNAYNVSSKGPLLDIRLNLNTKEVQVNLNPIKNHNKCSEMKKTKRN